MKIEWIEKYLASAEGMITSNQVDEGLELLNRLLYDEPGYGSLHNHIGWAYLYYSDNTAKAERHLVLATTFNPSFAAPYLHLGELYLRLARYDDVIAICVQGLMVPGVNRFAMFQNIARAYELKKDYRKAIAYFKEAFVATTGQEGNAMTEGIRRCRKKRLAMMFTF